MARKHDETAIEYMRRIVSHLDNEPESILEDFKTIHALVEFFELWAVYDTYYANGCQQLIESREASPKAWNSFVKKYDLPWVTYTATGKCRDEKEAA